jgi:hypothetical protein
VRYAGSELTHEPSGGNDGTPQLALVASDTKQIGGTAGPQGAGDVHWSSSATFAGNQMRRSSRSVPVRMQKLQIKEELAMTTTQSSTHRDTPWSDRANQPTSSVIVWLALLAYLALVKLILDAFFPQAFADPDQAAIFAWPVLGIIGSLGLIGAWLTTKTGFPSAWDARISNWRRILLPILLGVGFGLLEITVNELTDFSALQVARHGAAQQYTGFMPMLLAFTAASIIVEVLFRLFPVTLLLWLISNVLLKGRGQAQTFWTLAVVSSVLYALSQLIDLVILPVPVMVVLLLALFAESFSQAALFRKYSFLAAIVLRMAFYVVWNVLYIH